MTEKGELAGDRFKEGYNCAQAVLSAFQDETNTDMGTMVKIAAGFGAGMARHMDVCGAVTGGLMAIGLKYSSETCTDGQNKQLVLNKSQDLFSQFSSRFGTYICRNLLEGCDLNTEAGQLAFKEKNLRNVVCMNCVKESANMVASIIAE